MRCQIIACNMLGMCSSASCATPLVGSYTKLQVQQMQQMQHLQIPSSQPHAKSNSQSHSNQIHSIPCYLTPPPPSPNAQKRNPTPRHPHRPPQRLLLDIRPPHTQLIPLPHPILPLELCLHGLQAAHLPWVPRAAVDYEGGAGGEGGVDFLEARR